MSAARTAARYDTGDISTRNRILRIAVIFGNETVIVSVAATLTSKLKVRAAECVGHTAGRYAKGLHYKGPEYEGENERCDQPLEGVGDFGGPVLFRMLPGFFSLVAHLHNLKKTF